MGIWSCVIFYKYVFWDLLFIENSKKFQNSLKTAWQTRKLNPDPSLSFGHLRRCHQARPTRRHLAIQPEWFQPPTQHLRARSELVDRPWRFQPPLIMRPVGFCSSHPHQPIHGDGSWQRSLSKEDCWFEIWSFPIAGFSTPIPGIVHQFRLGGSFQLVACEHFGLGLAAPMWWFDRRLGFWVVVLWLHVWPFPKQFFALLCLVHRYE